jgi:transposase
MPSDPLPEDLGAAHAVILAQREMLTIARSEVTVGRLEIERLKLMLAKARREQFGQSSERGKHLSNSSSSPSRISKRRRPK